MDRYGRTDRNRRIGWREGWVALLAGLGFLVALCFLLEFGGIELMHVGGLLGQLLGFAVAYPLACLAPILLGWWLAHRHRHDDGFHGQHHAS